MVGPVFVCNLIPTICHIYDSMHYNFLLPDWEHDLMKSSEAMGFRGSGVVSLEMVAAFADNAESALLATHMRVGELPLIIVCMLLKVSCSNIDS